MSLYFSICSSYFSLFTISPPSIFFCYHIFTFSPNPWCTFNFRDLTYYTGERQRHWREKDENRKLTVRMQRHNDTRTKWISWCGEFSGVDWGTGLTLKCNWKQNVMLNVRSLSTVYCYQQSHTSVGAFAPQVAWIEFHKAGEKGVPKAATTQNLQTTLIINYLHFHTQDKNMSQLELKRMKISEDCVTGV